MRVGKKTTTGEFSTSSDNKILIQNPDPNLEIPWDRRTSPEFLPKKKSKSACRAAAYASGHFCIGTYVTSGLVLVAMSTPRKN